MYISTQTRVRFRGNTPNITIYQPQPGTWPHRCRYVVNAFWFLFLAPVFDITNYSLGLDRLRHRNSSAQYWIRFFRKRSFVTDGFRLGRHRCPRLGHYEDRNAPQDVISSINYVHMNLQRCLVL